MLEKDRSLKYISLTEAAKYSGCYSQEYLSLRARQGKLKAVKIARNWVTTKEWIDEYLEKANNYKNRVSDRGPATPEKQEKTGAQRESSVSPKPTPIFTPTFQPVPRAQVIAVVVALVFVLVSIGTLFAYPYFSPLLKSAVSSIKDGAIEVVSNVGEFTSDIGEGIVEVGDNVSESISYLTIDISTGANLINQKLSKNISNSFSNFKSGTIEYGIALKEGSLELGSRTVLVFRDFGTNISTGARAVRDLVVKGPKKFVTRISNGASLIAEKFSNKLAQRFIAGISDIPREFKYYLSQDIEALKSFSTRTILGISYRIKDFWNNLTYGLRDIDENINEGIKNIGKSVRYKTGQSVQLMIEGVQGFGERMKRGGQRSSDSFKKGYQYITRMVLDTFKEVPKKFVDIFKREAEPELPEEKLLPKPEKEGVVVIPSTEEDEEITQKIKASFSDEVRVEPKDESSGIIIPIFREIEGEEYLYLMVPVKD